MNRFRFHLSVNAYFAKLEKVPIKPELWMGIPEFKYPLDYSLFCCLLAFLEEKASDDLFLLSTICDYVKDYYPGEIKISWELINHRRSFVRVLMFAEEQGMLKVLDGDVEDFSHDGNSEVLYCSTSFSRYFARYFTKSLKEFNDIEGLLADGWEEEFDGKESKRVQKLYRKLFFSPVVHNSELTLGEREYLRQNRTQISNDIENYTDYQLELYKNEVMLISTERKIRLTLYPQTKAISDVALHFSALIRQKIIEKNIEPDKQLELSRLEFEKWVAECKALYCPGWFSGYREKALPDLKNELLEYLILWKLAGYDEETETIFLYPPIARVIGKYPNDFIKKADEEQENNEQMDAL